MNPLLLYSQAIQGRFTGRGIGVIDTIHLVELARAIEMLEAPAFTKPELAGVKKWFADYLNWMTTHKYGTDERDAKNNHGTCWVMQAAAFAQLTGNDELMAYCSDRFKDSPVPNQIAAGWKLPEELRRTKPYGYSLFNSDAMATICQILSTPRTICGSSNCRTDGEFAARWTTCSPISRIRSVAAQAGRDVRQGVADAACSLLFAGEALGQSAYIELWKTLKAIPMSKK